ncbi:MAG TPA: type II toxin-antitoxin system VapC family toxin [Phycisphaerales bacterium]|nr:type II toxin-antitoxin system VapC family toxin [Phycisphaerales bacterium]
MKRADDGVVLDCSITMTFCFPDEATPATTTFFRSLAKRRAVVPALWRLEVTNVLAVALRRGRIMAADLQTMLDDLTDLGPEIDHSAADRAFTHIRALCADHRITSYDAAYLDLAMQRSLPLATLDATLRKAARTCGVPTIQLT